MGECLKKTCRIFYQRQLNQASSEQAQTAKMLAVEIAGNARHQKLEGIRSKQVAEFEWAGKQQGSGLDGLRDRR